MYEDFLNWYRNEYLTNKKSRKADETARNNQVLYLDAISSTAAHDTNQAEEVHPQNTLPILQLEKEPEKRRIEQKH